MPTVTNEQLDEKLTAMQKDLATLLTAVKQIEAQLNEDTPSDEEFYDAEGGE